MTVEIMPGFTLTDIETRGARIRLRHGGSGPPLLLLHGNPLTYVSWHALAPQLAERFHVVAADLRGYGDSSAPPEEFHPCTAGSMRQFLTLRHRRWRALVA